MLTEMTMMDGRTFRLGERVKFHTSVGCIGIGTISQIRLTSGRHEMFHIEPELENTTFGDLGYYPLNPDSAKAHGKTHWMRCRDLGVSGGCMEKVA